MLLFSHYTTSTHGQHGQIPTWCIFARVLQAADTLLYKFATVWDPSAMEMLLSTKTQAVPFLLGKLIPDLNTKVSNNGLRWPEINKELGPKITGHMKFLDEEFDEALAWERPRAGDGGRTACGAPCCGLELSPMHLNTALKSQDDFFHAM